MLRVQISGAEHRLILNYAPGVFLKQNMRVFLGIIKAYVLAKLLKLRSARICSVRVARRDVGKPLREHKLRRPLRALTEITENTVFIYLHNIACGKPTLRQGSVPLHGVISLRVRYDGNKPLGKYLLKARIHLYRILVKCKLNEQISAACEGQQLFLPYQLGYIRRTENLCASQNFERYLCCVYGLAQSDELF